MKIIIISMVFMFFIIINSSYAETIAINNINPPSLITIKNREFTTAVTYTIEGTFDTCYLKIDELSLPTGWKVIEGNPKQIPCNSETTKIPKILATTTGSKDITIIIEGKGVSPRQATNTFHVTVKEGAILDISLISPSTISIEKGKSYQIKFNVKNKGDMNTENAIALITCPNGYSCPSNLTLKEAQQPNGVIRAGYTAFASFEIKASNNPTSGYVTIKVTASNSQVTDEVKIYLSYTPKSPQETPSQKGSTKGISPPISVEKSKNVSEKVIKNVSERVNLSSSIKLKNHTKLQHAIAKLFKIPKLNEQIIENLINVSRAIIPKIEVVKEFKIDDNKSVLSIKLKYRGQKRIINFIVWNKIPKTFANNVNNITVYASEAKIEIVESDPEYVLLYPEITPNRSITIVYETFGKKDINVLNATEIEIYAEKIMDSFTEKETNICTPKTKRCLGNNLQECSEDGSSWKTLQICEWGCDPISLKCKEKPKNKTNYLWIVIIAILIGLILILVVFYKIKRK